MQQDKWIACFVREQVKFAHSYAQMFFISSSVSVSSLVEQYNQIA